MLDIGLCIFNRGKGISESTPGTEEAQTLTYGHAHICIYSILYIYIVDVCV